MQQTHSNNPAEPRPLHILFRLMEVPPSAQKFMIEAFGDLPDQPTVRLVGRHLAVVLERQLVFRADLNEIQAEIRRRSRLGAPIRKSLLEKLNYVDEWDDHYTDKVTQVSMILRKLMVDLEEREVAGKLDNEHEGGTAG